MKKSLSAWPRSRGSTPTAPRRSGTIARASLPARATPATAEATLEREAAERPGASPGKPEREAKAEDARVAIWEVKEGVGRGGLVVYEGKEEGALVAGQLRAGARLREIATEGPFLHFWKLLGHGPEFGWVRMRLHGVERVERLGRKKAAAPAPKEPAAPQAGASREQGAGRDASEPLQGAAVWIVALGDRGDVQPLVALGAQLRKAGCLVRAFGPPQFEAIAESSDLLFCRIGVGFWAFWSVSPELWGLQQHEAFRIWVEQDLCSSTQVVLTEMEAGRPDLVITNHYSVNVAAVAVRTHSVPALLVHVRVDPFPTELKTTGLSYLDFLHVEGVCARRRPGVSTLGRHTSFREWCELLDSLPFLVATSPLITSGLRFEHQQEAAKTMTFVGNLVVEEQRPLEEPAIFGSSNELKRVQDFIGRTSSLPVYVGWGGAVCVKGPHHMIVVAGCAIVASGKSAIIATGRSGISLGLFEEGLHLMAQLDASWTPQVIADHISYLERNAIFVEAVPHEWLLMRCSCTVHHGGAGTTAAALRAGVPMVITPIKDRHLQYAAWVNILGAGIGFDKTLDHASSQELAWCLANATESKKRAKAREIGRAMRREDADGTALSHVRSIVRDAHSGGTNVRRESDGQSRAETPPRDPPSDEEPISDTLQHQSGKVWILTFEVPEEHSFLALGVELRKAGYSVTLFGRTSFRDLASLCGLDFVEIAPGLDEVMQRPDAIEALSSGPERSEEFLWSWLEGALPAAVGPVVSAMGAGTPDVLVLDYRSLGIGLAAQKIFGVRLLLAHPWAPFENRHEPDHECICAYASMARTRSWESPVPDKEWWAQVTSPGNTLVSLPRILLGGLPPELRLLSESFASMGAWTFRSTPPMYRSEEEALKTFMAQDMPTALVAWGDAICHSRSWMVLQAVVALRFAGFRGVVVQGTASLDMELLRSSLREVEDAYGLCSYAEANIIFVKTYPPAWLLRRCACAVHHGGATITGATLHAGLPSIVTPFVRDQFAYARILEELGVGRSMGDLRHLSGAVLSLLLRDVGFNESMRQHAISMSEVVQKDFGVQAAVAFIRKEIHARSGGG